MPLVLPATINLSMKQSLTSLFNDFKAQIQSLIGWRTLASEVANISTNIIHIMSTDSNVVTVDTIKNSSIVSYAERMKGTSGTTISSIIGLSKARRMP